MKKQKVLKDGSKGKGICGGCKESVPITFEFRTLSSHQVGFSQIPLLAGSCDECGDVVSIPHQSVNQIKQSKQAFRKINFK